jgi:hypothetical protein
MDKIVVDDNSARSPPKVVQRARRNGEPDVYRAGNMNWRGYEGRFSVEFEVADHEEVVQAKKGFLPRSIECGLSTRRIGGITLRLPAT